MKPYGPSASLACLVAFVSAVALADETAQRFPTDELRGQRYCEVLAGGMAGLHLSLDVYNTIGLSDCPAESWQKLDANAIQKDLGVSRVKLNGPRYWTIDRFENAKLMDSATRTFGGIPMRKAGVLQLSLLDMLSLGKPYVTHTVRRDTTEVFIAGKRVYQLIDPKGRTFFMQSYSVQEKPQTEESLATLGTRLQLPKGWSFKTLTIATDTRVSTVDGYATVVQDDYGNTYQLSAK